MEEGEPLYRRFRYVSFLLFLLGWACDVRAVYGYKELPQIFTGPAERHTREIGNLARKVGASAYARET